MSGAASIPFAPYAGAQTSRNGTGADAWRHVDWCTHQRWVPVEGRPVNVLELGSGAPVVFVHGLGGSWPNWLHQLPAIAAGWRTIALDLPGFGHSPMPADPISISGYAAAVTGAMDALGIPSATLVGNSMGGEISAELAISHPDRVQRIVLVSPAGISTAALTARMALIRRAHPAVHLGRDYHILPADRIRQRAAQNFLAGAVRVHIGRVEKINAHIQSLFDKRARLIFGEHPRMIAPLRDAVTHAAKTNPRHLKSGSPQSRVLHRPPPQSFSAIVPQSGTRFAKQEPVVEWA